MSAEVATTDTPTYNALRQGAQEFARLERMEADANGVSRDNPFHLFQTARLCARLKLVGKAAAYYQRAVEATDSMLADDYHCGRYTEYLAKLKAEESSASGATLARVHLFMGRCYRRLGDHSLADQYMRQAASEAEESGDPYFEQGECRDREPLSAAVQEQLQQAVVQARWELKSLEMYAEEGVGLS